MFREMLNIFKKEKEQNKRMQIINQLMICLVKCLPFLEKEQNKCMQII